ncbi:hypothetical protein CDD82_3003 [Ophiocordyceps australis]|uniref:glucan 1,3-beta-glucosidase n=1 Tax=Ophiocordyceps australis TaxID=1399860 RepID=A0A2C5ZET6_9HYPO|nr:hypothetical protein CDD82_3003 [Ophiocordyceps australis]
MSPRESAPRAAHRHRQRHAGEASRRRQHGKKSKTARGPCVASTQGKEETLSAGALARLNRENARKKAQVARSGKEEAVPPTGRKRHAPKAKKKRVVSGAMMEEGRVGKSGLRGGGWSQDSLDKHDFYGRGREHKSRRKRWIMVGCLIVVVVMVIVVVGVVVSKKRTQQGSSSSLDGQDRGKIPTKWQNTYLDPWSWQSTTDFNVTFTAETVGDLPIMGLFTQWDDSKRANDRVPPLSQKWGSYAKNPARGVNLGGWLSLEPFITPSLFNYDSKLGIVDEWSLCQHLGASASKTLEAHYASFVTEQTFKDIAAAGLDHVRIPFSYWAVQVYTGDAYIYRTSWRYLLRGIEWARKYGLRVSLDLHGLPGSQNGWNHSGRFGTIGWLNGSEGQVNGQRSLELHDRLSKFFAQPRYSSILTHYGLVNEPRMTFLQAADVVQWTKQAYDVVRANGVQALVVFGDGFMGLDNWKGLLPARQDLVLDVHQYVIFNNDQLVFSHQQKVEYACTGWTAQAELSQDPGRGYGGPTVFAEWSQADTDCAPLLTGVGWGNRWEGTFDTGDRSTSTLTPRCPAKDSTCKCGRQDVAAMSSQYKRFLRMFAEAQMHSFERGWGWWYWTWKTENAPLWSYQAGLEAGILPSQPWERDFDCHADVPDFDKADGGLAETE